MYVFYSFDLDRDPITLALKLDLYTKMKLCAKMKFLTQVGQKLLPEEAQADRHNGKHYLSQNADGKYIVIYLSDKGKQTSLENGSKNDFQTKSFFSFYRCVFPEIIGKRVLSIGKSVF